MSKATAWIASVGDPVEIHRNEAARILRGWRKTGIVKRKVRPFAGYTRYATLLQAIYVRII